MVKDLDLGISIITGPIVREQDGLAMSSRNIYLSKIQRENAVVLHESLKWLKQAYINGLRDPQLAKSKMASKIRRKKGKVD